MNLAAPHQPIDRQQAEQFIEALTGDPNTPVTFQTFDDSKKKRNALARKPHGTIEECIGELNAMQARGAGAFICVNATDLRGRSAENVTALRALFADADGVEPDMSLVPPPSITVQSKRGKHYYWLLQEGESLLRFESAQARIANGLGTDPAIIDLPRVMRLPGSTHQKGDPYRVTMVSAEQLFYTIDEVIAKLPEHQEQTWEAVRPSFANLDRDTAVEQARRYMAKVDPAVEGNGGDRQTYRAACIAAVGFDLSEADALEVMREWNQRCSPPWEDKGLVAKIRSARKSARRAPGNLLRERPAERRFSGFSKPEPQTPATPKQSLRDIMKQAVFAPGRKGDVAIAAQFIEDLAAFHGATPVATRGALYAYNAELGIWDELTRDIIESLVQAYDGCPVETIDQHGEVRSRPLELSASRCEGIAKCAIRSDAIRDPAFFEQQKPGVVFANGVVTITPAGLVFAEKSPEHRALAALPFDYQQGAQCPEWMRIMHRVFERDGSDAEDKRRLLQEFVGACMAGVAYDFTRCLVLSGAGNNGKNVVADLIARHLFPSSAVTRVPPQQFGKGEFVAALRNSRLNVASELPAYEIGASEMFKAVIDGNEITARSLYKDPFVFRPTAGHLFLANELPGTRDHTDGYWRRFLVLAFNRNFDSDPDETGRVRRKDEILALLRDELPGIALWGLDGAVRLLSQGRYTLPASHVDELREWRLSTDPVASFVEQCCAQSEAGERLMDIYQALCTRFEQTGHKPMTIEKLGSRLRSLGIKRLGKGNRGAKYAIRVLERPLWDEQREASWLRLVK